VRTGNVYEGVAGEFAVGHIKGMWRGASSRGAFGSSKPKPGRLTTTDDDR